jgi:hypothetical protein
MWAATRNPIDDLAADAKHGDVDLRIESRNEVGKALISATEVLVVRVHQEP